MALYVPPLADPRTWAPGAVSAERDPSAVGGGAPLRSRAPRWQNVATIIMGLVALGLYIGVFAGLPYLEGGEAIMLLPPLIALIYGLCSRGSLELVHSFFMFLIGFFGAIPVLVAELAVGVLAVGVFGKRTMSEDGSGDSTDSGGGSVSALTVLGIFINSFLVAGLCEEGLKFVLATVYRRLRPELRSFRAILFYGTLGPLGFAASENLLYLVSNGLTNKDVSSGLTLSVMRVLIPLHPMTGYLITLGVIERDFFNQPQLKWLRICAWPIFFHGLFDFGIFLMSAFIDGNQRDGETSEDASWRVLVYLIAFVLAVLAGLATVIVLTYRRLFHRQGFQPLQPVV